jgi:hypothetical protein
LTREDAPDSASTSGKFGFVAPPLLRTVTLLAWFSLLARMVSSALPGSRSGIEPWIKRTDVVSSLLTQLSVLLGSGLLVMLVVTTVADRGFRYSYRIVVVPAAAVVLMLVMLASTTGLDAPASLFLGLACLALAAASAGTALGVPSSRAQGLVLSMVALGGACRLAVRAIGVGASLPPDAAWYSRATWVLAAGSAFDFFAVALAATRLLGERRRQATFALSGILVLSGVVAWGALRGSLEGARTWQVIAARSLSDLAANPTTAHPAGASFTLDSLAVLLAGAVALWPGRLSSGIVAVGLALLSRPGVDVPASALLLALGALAAPLGASSETPAPASAKSPDRAATGRESTAGADG